MLFRYLGFFCILLQTSRIKLRLVGQILILFSRSLFVPQETYFGKILNSFSIQYENWFLTVTIPDFYDPQIQVPLLVLGKTLHKWSPHFEFKLTLDPFFHISSNQNT